MCSSIKVRSPVARSMSCQLKAYPGESLTHGDICSRCPNLGRWNRWSSDTVLAQSKSRGVSLSVYLKLPLCVKHGRIDDLKDTAKRTILCIAKCTPPRRD